MSPPEGPNPERRSTGAIWCFGAGAALTSLAWVFGVGGVMTAAMSGGDPAALAGGIAMIVMLGLTTLVGVVLMVIGGVWMLAQVVADQRGEPSEQRYRDIER
jgi:hypothetical protein